MVMCISDFWGRISHTTHTLVDFRSLGFYWWNMNATVSVTVCAFHPCDRKKNSLYIEFFPDWWILLDYGVQPKNKDNFVFKHYKNSRKKKHTNARRYCVCSAVLAVLTSKEIPLAFKLIKTGARMQMFEHEFYLQGSFHCKLASSVEPNRPFGSTDKAEFLIGRGSLMGQCLKCQVLKIY